MTTLLATLLIALSTTQAAGVPIFAQVTTVRGKARIVTPTSWTRVAVGDRVGAGQSLTVTPGAEVTLMALGRSAFWVKGPAEISFEKFGDQTSILVKKGSLLSTLRPLALNKKHSFQVRTHSVVLGARGTSMYVEARPGQADFICVCEGSVALIPPAGGKDILIQAKHHDAPKIVGPGTGPLNNRLFKAAMGHGHSDEEIEFLKKSIR